MQTWPTLEQRFRLLIPEMKYIRLDDQTGAAGEHWRLAGGFASKSTIEEFKLLSMLAGSLLKEVGRNKPELKEIIDHDDNAICWYRALKKFSKCHEIGLPAFITDKDGNDKGTIFTGSIHNVPENSANVCLFLELHYPVRMRWYKKVWNEYGKEIIIGVTVTALGGIIATLLKLL